MSRVLRFISVISGLALAVAARASSYYNNFDASVKGNYYHCETTDGSPFIEDCKAILDQMKPDVVKEGVCYLLNSTGSGCKTLKKYGTCAVGVCVVDSVWDRKIDPGAVSSGGHFLLSACGNNSRVGGYFHYESLNVANGRRCKKAGTYANVEFFPA
ncbi:hypothetical protein F4778DRAFT_779741 [Xylariomycetidae sp. FL2044]|nr:hypothetical protein F4778DRAFT_779741 [Xylariomycetidae sp. FL2044]